MCRSELVRRGEEVKGSLCHSCKESLLSMFCAQKSILKQPVLCYLLTKVKMRRIFPKKDANKWKDVVILIVWCIVFSYLHS